MQQHERHRCASNQRTVATLMDIADQIHTSHQLVDAAFMAVHQLTDDQRGPLAALLDLVSAKLKATAADIKIRSAKEAADAA